MQFKRATLDDSDLLLKWRNDPVTRNNSHNKETISREDHIKWLKSSLTNRNRLLYIAVKNKPVGVVRGDYDNGIFELSWTVAPEHRGNGIGKEMVKFFYEILNARIRAEILEGNIASVKIAEHIGLTFRKKENGILHYSNYGFK